MKAYFSKGCDSKIWRLPKILALAKLRYNAEINGLSKI